MSSITEARSLVELARLIEIQEIQITGLKKELAVLELAPFTLDPISYQNLKNEMDLLIATRIQIEQQFFEKLWLLKINF